MAYASAYPSMKRLITNENKAYETGMITSEEYELWKDNTLSKLDVFFACNRLTPMQYEELLNMLISTDETTT